MGEDATSTKDVCSTKKKIRRDSVVKRILIFFFNLNHLNYFQNEIPKKCYKLNCYLTAGPV